jgi:hypothetical protein
VAGEHNAEFGDVAQYRELNPIGTGRRLRLSLDYQVCEAPSRTVLIWRLSIFVISGFYRELTIDRRVSRSALSRPSGPTDRPGC